MKRFILSLLASAFLAGPALADTESQDAPPATLEVTCEFVTEHIKTAFKDGGIYALTYSLNEFAAMSCSPEDLIKSTSLYNSKGDLCADIRSEAADMLSTPSTDFEEGMELALTNLLKAANKAAQCDIELLN